jgi:hypothetical protein
MRGRRPPLRHKSDPSKPRRATKGDVSGRREIRIEIVAPAWTAVLQDVVQRTLFPRPQHRPRNGSGRLQEELMRPEFKAPPSGGSGRRQARGIMCGRFVRHSRRPRCGSIRLRLCNSGQRSNGRRRSRRLRRRRCVLLRRSSVSSTSPRGLRPLRALQRLFLELHPLRDPTPMKFAPRVEILRRGRPRIMVVGAARAAVRVSAEWKDRRGDFRGRAGPLDPLQLWRGFMPRTLAL